MGLLQLSWKNAARGRGASAALPWARHSSSWSPGLGEQVLVHLHQLEAGVLAAGFGQALRQVVVQFAVQVAAHGVGASRPGRQAGAAALGLPVPVGDLDGAVLVPAVVHHAEFRV